MTEIITIPTDRLHPHPDNPRKELGDLTELADSIQANGILQNLTVVPAMLVPAIRDRICGSPDAEHEATYVVIIGHRRLAAAKLAGISELPCAVTSMTAQEQLRTMLVENMQRSELTPYEQAHGFQMMLDMGDTVENIAKDSGFSVSTIRRRVDLLKFEDKTFRDATTKQITLDTLSEVAKIENPKKRDQILSSFGSNNFQWDLEKALDDQKAKKNAPAAKEEILTYAQKVDQVNYNQYEQVLSVRFSRYTPGSATPKDGTEGEFVATFSATFATVYKKIKRQPAEKRSPDEIERDRELKRREAELAELTEAAYKLRRDFVTRLSVHKADYPKLMKHACRVLIACRVRYCGGNFAENYAKLIGLEVPAYGIPNDTCKFLTADLDKTELCVPSLIAAIYAGYGDTKSNGYWQKQYRGMPIHNDSNLPLDYLYDFLCAFGYEMSDEEKALKDGTHALLKETQ